MVIPPDGAAVTVPIRHSSVTRRSVITFGCDNLTGSNDPDAVASIIQGAIDNAGGLASIVDNGCTLGPVEIRLGQVGADPLLGFASTTFLGTRSQSSVSPNVALLVKKRSALGGRMNRGRMFIPWAVREDQLDEGGIIAAADVTTAQNAMNTMLADLTAANVPMHIFHQTALVLAPAVTALIVDPLVATQRRRLGR